MTATIRSAVIGDEELLAKLNGFVQEVHLERRPDDFKRTTIPELAAWYGSLLRTSTARMWIAEDAGLPVGYILAIVHQRSENPFCPDRHWCELDQIAVDPKYRRQGIGRALVLRAIAEVRVDGIREIEVTSWSFNRETHALLRRLGFVPKTIRFELKSSPI